jgi:CheY-like chemotaxis protein
MSDDKIPFALVADDDALVRMNSADILDGAGFHVLEAANVAQAIQILESNGAAITLLFTDVQMPPSHRTGFELARECAQAWPHVGILVASGVSAPAPGELPAGAVFINKPFSAEVVYDRLQELLPPDVQPKPLRRTTR